MAKFRGEFTFHRHDNEDEMFLVVKGSIKIDFQDKTVHLNEGEFIIVPAGQVHKPVADDEAYVMLFVKDTNRNTGNIENEQTRTNLLRL